MGFVFLAVCVVLAIYGVLRLASTLNGRQHVCLLATAVVLAAVIIAVSWHFGKPWDGETGGDFLWLLALPFWFGGAGAYGVHPALGFVVGGLAQTAFSWLVVATGWACVKLLARSA